MVFSTTWYLYNSAYTLNVMINCITQVVQRMTEFSNRYTHKKKVLAIEEIII